MKHNKCYTAKHIKWIGLKHKLSATILDNLCFNLGNNNQFSFFLVCSFVCMFVLFLFCIHADSVIGLWLLNSACKSINKQQQQPPPPPLLFILWQQSFLLRTNRTFLCSVASPHTNEVFELIDTFIKLYLNNLNGFRCFLIFTFAVVLHSC
jgi:hypothetical protein